MGTLVHAIAASDALYASLALDEATSLVIGPLVVGGDQVEIGVGYLVAVITRLPTLPSPDAATLRHGHAALLAMLGELTVLLRTQRGWGHPQGVWVVDSLEAAIVVLRRAGYEVSPDSPWQPLLPMAHIAGRERASEVSA